MTGRLRVCRGTFGISILANRVSVCTMWLQLRATKAEGSFVPFHMRRLVSRTFRSRARQYVFFLPLPVAVPRDDRQRRRWGNQVASLAIKFETRERNTHRCSGKREESISSANYQKWRRVGFSYEQTSSHQKSSFFFARTLYPPTRVLTERQSLRGCWNSVFDLAIKTTTARGVREARVNVSSPAAARLSRCGDRKSIVHN